MDPNSILSERKAALNKHQKNTLLLILALESMLSDLNKEVKALERNPRSEDRSEDEKKKGLLKDSVSSIQAEINILRACYFNMASCIKRGQRKW